MNTARGAIVALLKTEPAVRFSGSSNTFNGICGLCCCGRTGGRLLRCA
ncbi:MAG: hypothetical protein SOX31_03665 [Eubacteriales bacterium]|nr:hypothetical protein [Eubacteriales bacterium]MDY3285660.1 hypothetical protein [Eubacteriales bacterium]